LHFQGILAREFALDPLHVLLNGFFHFEYTPTIRLTGKGYRSQDERFVELRRDLVRPGQIARHNQTDPGNDDEDAPPIGLIARFGYGHPDNDAHDDVHPGNEAEDDPPDGLFGDIQHQDDMDDGNPGKPGIFGMGFLRDGL